PTFDSRTDWGTNTALFIPIGFLATGLLLGRKSSDRRRILTLPLVACGCVLFSVAVECAQLWTSDRICSQSDMVAQSIGGLLGASAWLLFGPKAARWLEQFRGDQRPRQRIERLLQGYLLISFAYHLMPLDITVRPT